MDEPPRNFQTEYLKLFDNEYYFHINVLENRITRTIHIDEMGNALEIVTDKNGEKWYKFLVDKKF